MDGARWDRGMEMVQDQYPVILDVLNFSGRDVQSDAHDSLLTH